MFIAHYIKTSLVDWEPHIVTTLFTKGCNMTCAYCHNQGLNIVDKKVEIAEIFEHLKKRKGILDGVVISGGEPTIHADLPEFISHIKELGYKVKLDTNGSNPDMLRFLIDAALVDHIAMDIKATAVEYERISGCDFSLVERSFNIIRTSPSYEFRTTLYPGLSEQDIHKMCQLYKDEPYYLQQYRVNEENAMEPYSDVFVKALGQQYGINVRGI